MGSLLALWRDRRRASADVKRVAEDHIQEIDLRMEELKTMRRTLTHLIERCHGDDRPDCPILEGLAGRDSALRAVATDSPACHAVNGAKMTKK